MKVSIIVPTLNRPRLLEKLIANIQATTLSDNYELIILVEDGDNETWNFLGANSFPSNIQVHSIPTSSSPIAAWNYGLRKSQFPWILLAADDIEFPSYWLEDALNTPNQGFLALPEKEGGTPNLNWEPHFMATRAWLKEFQHGVLTIPHYRHWGTDVETCDRATRSNTFTRARTIVKHHHWMKNASLIDSTYQNAQKFYNRDIMLYQTRRSMGFPDDFDSVI